MWEVLLLFFLSVFLYMSAKMCEWFQRDKMVQAKNEFKALLKETKKIDYM